MNRTTERLKTGTKGYSFYFKGISTKVAILAWLHVMVTVTLFGIVIFYTQKDVLNERLELEAKNVETSIIENYQGAIISDDYQFMLDYFTGMVNSSKSINFVVLTKQKDSTSIVVSKNSWKLQKLSGFWLNPPMKNRGLITTPDKEFGESFVSSTFFEYSGIEWGWIHIGLSLDTYYEAENRIMITSFTIAGILSILSFIAVLIFSRKITAPIKEISVAALKMEDGDYNTRVQFEGSDEVGRLARIFNRMATAIQDSKIDLERKVYDRTKDLEEINDTLSKEIFNRVEAENTLKRYYLRNMVLQEIYKEIISAKSVNEIFEKVSDILHEKYLAFTSSSLVLFDDQSKIHPSETFFYKNEKKEKFSTSFEDSSFNSENRLLNNNYYVTNLSDFEKMTEVEKTFFKKGIRSYLCVAIKSNNELLGEFDFGFCENTDLTKDTLETLLEISNQTALTIVKFKLEEEIAKHSDELQSSLKEKVILLQEIHHRVKNNLQIVSSLLYLQSINITDVKTGQALKDSQNRIRTLALVHEKLYQSDNLSHINFTEYTKKLTNFIVSSYNISPLIKIKHRMEECSLPINIISPLGLIINELLSNILKYAFPDPYINSVDKPNIYIDLAYGENQEFVFTISDNGIGLPDDFSIDSSESLGLKLVTNLVRQIDGTLKINLRNRTEFEITIPKKNLI